MEKHELRVTEEEKPEGTGTTERVPNSSRQLHKLNPFDTIKIQNLEADEDAKDVSPLVEPSEQPTKPAMFSTISKVAMEMKSASKKSSDKKSDKSPLDKSVKENPAFKYPNNLRNKLK